MSNVDPDAALALDASPALGKLAPGVKRLVVPCLHARTFAPGDEILRQGDPGDGFYLVAAGKAAVRMRDGAGEVYELARFGRGAVFGEMSLVTGEPVSADVVAVDSLRVYHLPADLFHRIVAAFPEIGIALTYLIAERLGHDSVDGLGGKHLDRYRIQRCVGRGSMAVVYRAQEDAGDEGDEGAEEGATVALKMMSHRLCFDEGALERFQLEADVLMSLQHPCVAGLRRRFDALGTCFLAMEFCDGQDLERLVARRGPLPEPEVRKIVGHLAAALEHLHGREVLHRDLKPSNVMTTRAGAVKLTDFGLAKPCSVAGAEREEDALGTPVYMAPELFEGAPASPATDCYALGCVALELVTGAPAFVVEDIRELMQAKQDHDASDLRHLDLGRELREALGALLATRPADRAVSLGDLARWADPLDPTLCATGEN